MLAETSHSPHNPIEKKEHDRLGRQTLAEGLAKVVLENYKDQPGYTVAVYGGWGSGKTSVMNMVEKALIKQREEAKKTEPIIVKFNPWFYGHTKQLDTLFLDALFQAIETHLLKEPINNKIIEQRLDNSQESLGWFLLKLELLYLLTLVFYPELILQFPTFFWKYIHFLLLGLLFLATFKGCWEKVNHFIKIGGSFSQDVKAFEALVKPAMEHFELKELKNLTWLSNVLINQLPPETELTKKINQHLEKLDTPVVVFLDDLDRLTNEEVLTVFRLMREVANFKNVAYIVGIDKDQTARAIKSQQHCTDGMEYLEKIIHYSIDLVLSNKEKVYLLESVCFNNLISNNEEIHTAFYGSFTRFYQSEREEKKRQVLLQMISQTLLSPRRLMELLQTVKSELMVQHKQVNIFDYFLMTFLRLNRPQLYKELYEKQQYLKSETFKKQYISSKQELETPYKEIIEFLLVEKYFLAGSSSSGWGDEPMYRNSTDMEPKRYIFNTEPYFMLKSASEYFLASQILKDEITPRTIDVLTFNFLIDEMKYKQNFNITLKIIEVLTEHLKHTSFANSQQEEYQERIKFNFAYERFINEVIALPRFDEYLKELSDALKKCILESSNFRLLDEFLEKGLTEPMAKAVGHDYLTNKELKISFEKKILAELPSLWKQYDVSEEIQQTWKNIFTNYCTNNRSDTNQPKEMQDYYNLEYLTQLLDSVYKTLNNEFRYFILERLLNFDDAIILQKLEHIQNFYNLEWRKTQSKQPTDVTYCYPTPEYVSKGALATLIEEIKTKHGGT